MRLLPYPSDIQVAGHLMRQLPPRLSKMLNSRHHLSWVGPLVALHGDHQVNEALNDTLYTLKTSPSSTRYTSPARSRHWGTGTLRSVATDDVVQATDLYTPLLMDHIERSSSTKRDEKLTVQTQRHGSRPRLNRWIGAWLSYSIIVCAVPI